MHYWNQRNFEGLLSIAEVLETCDELALLARYCRLREQGLRHEALARLEDFLHVSSSWTDETARRACIRILETHARSPEVHQFLTQPLLSRLILPVLHRWEDEAPDNQLVIRWLGLLNHDRARLQKALELDQSDVPVRRRLVGIHLGAVDYATHHLSEGIILGDLEAMTWELNEARKLLESAPDAASFAPLLDEVSGYERMLDDWRTYSASPEGTFPEWCARGNRRYSWPVIVYYDK